MAMQAGWFVKVSSTSSVARQAGWFVKVSFTSSVEELATGDNTTTLSNVWISEAWV